MDYKYQDATGKAKVFGGMVKKMQKHIAQHERIQQIIQEIHDISEERT